MGRPSSQRIAFSAQTITLGGGRAVLALTCCFVLSLAACGADDCKEDKKSDSATQEGGAGEAADDASADDKSDKSNDEEDEDDDQPKGTATEEGEDGPKGTEVPSSEDKDAEDAEGSANAARPTSVETEDGPVSGEILTHEDKNIHVFRGLPYAAPPVGEFRWKPPQPVKPWTEVRDATRWGDRAPQPESRLLEVGEISEDCLNLNVITPSLEGEDKLPVMVFFHGGGLSIGTANSPTYSNTALPAQGVVVVTVNQRLGPFGYFSHPALAQESAEGASGNYGVLDQIAALKWVQTNIDAFGGDADNVTIFGESGGGSKVLSCMASPLAKGLFHRAIVQSGSRSSQPGAVTEREAAEMNGTALAKQLGIEDGDEQALAKLRELSWEAIIEASEAEGSTFAANLAIDGWVFPQSVNDAFAQGAQADVPLIVGANEGEAGELMASVPELAASMSSVSSAAYVYVFSYVPPGWRAEDCYAFHGLELAYMFGHLPGLETPTMRFLGMSAGCPTEGDPMASKEDEQVARNSMKIWAQFAKTGDPSVPDLIDWPAYTKEGDQYLDINVELEVKQGVSGAGKAAPGIGGSE